VAEAVEMSDENKPRPRGGLYDETWALLQDVTHDITAPLMEKGIGAEHKDTPEAAALRLRRRELEDQAIRALHELANRGQEWGLVADVVKDSEAWWVYMVLVERAYETLPDQIPGDA
jgi:hypothetical protein